MTTIEEPGFQAEDYRVGTDDFDDPGTPRIPDGVVELRVHGVAGGTPSQNLGDPHPIHINGDAEAGIYRRRSEIRIGPARAVEAYNWSAINSGRTVRALWIVLFPFAAANFAGWLLPEGMRDPRGDADADARADEEAIQALRDAKEAAFRDAGEDPFTSPPDDATRIERWRWNAGKWAYEFQFSAARVERRANRVVQGLVDPWKSRMWAQTAIRILALLCTTLLILGVAAISMDIVGLQCGIRGACSEPWWFGWFESVREAPWLAGQPARFLIVGALAPLAVLGVLWLLTKRSSNYDRYGTSSSGDGSDDDREPKGPYADTIRLDTIDFWQAPDTVYIQGWLNTAVSLTVMAIVLAASIVQVDQASSIRGVYIGIAMVGFVWLFVLAIFVLMVARMRQVPHSPLRRALKPGFWPPRLTWIPAAVPLVLLAATAILGWNEGGSLPSDTYVLEPIRNAFIWITVIGFVLLVVIGLLVGAWRAIVMVLGVGALWYVALASANTLDGRLGEAPFLLDIGEGWQWLVAEAVVAFFFTLFAGATAEERLIRPSRGPHDDPNRRHGMLYVVGSSAVLVGLAMGADARTTGRWWWLVALISALIVLFYLWGAFSIRAAVGRSSDRLIDAPEAGSLRWGAAFVLGAIGLTSTLAIVSSVVVWIADALGGGVPHTGDQEVMSGQVAYPAEAGWFALAAVVGILVFVGMLVLRMVALRMFRWTKETARGICECYDDVEAPDDVHNPPPCPHEKDDAQLPRDHGGWRLEHAERSRTLRMFANLIDEIDWVTSAAVLATLAVVFGSVIARLRDNVPGGRLDDAVAGATWVLALLVVALFFLIRSARDDRQLRATVGILWDVMSFFPRRFHPLAPPCYSERTVIELRNRLIEYERHEPDRGKILLAHSQGTMLTAATLLSLNGPAPTIPPPSHRERTGRELQELAFITYGCMIERLFRRAWPDQLRRNDLVELKRTIEGIEPDQSVAPATESDPLQEFPEPDGSVRWMNFGRYTDYLGGRVFSSLQLKPTPTSPEQPDADDRCDDIMFQDPTRRWRFVGETTGPRTWLHSFNYESDTEDPRFREHVWGWARQFAGTSPPGPLGWAGDGSDSDVAEDGATDGRHD